jgi:hypothetical protein
LLLGAQEFVAPFDRRPKRPLAFRDVPGAAGEQRKTLFEPLEDLLRGQSFHACGRKLDREREIVEALADLRHRLVGAEVGVDRPRPGQEELDPVIAGECRHRVLLLPGDVQRLAARDDDVEVRTRGEELAEPGPRFDHVLEVVEEDQHRALADMLGEAVRRADHLPGRREHELRIAQGRERHPPDSVRVALGESSGRLQAEARLAGASRSGQREEANGIL